MDPNPPQGNAAVIRELLRELDRLGVVEYCVAAGARNAPLLAALAQRKKAGKFLHFFEERSAGFFALGRVMDTRKPVAVFTTSGTAVAELLPAVIEAYYQGLPLVVVSADRPSHYRGSGAPQAIEQVGIFGKYVVREAEIEWLAGHGLQLSDGMATDGGPMHFNVCLEEGMEVPLMEDEDPGEAFRIDESRCEFYQQDWQEFWDAEGDLVVLAGGIHPGDVPAARDFLIKLNAPVVMEATSNLTDDPALAALRLHGGEKALASLQATRVLRLGSVPSWRWWRDLEKREDVKVLNVSRAPFRGLARSQGVSVVPWEMLKEGFKVQGLRFKEGARASSLTEVLEAYPQAEPAWMKHLSRVIGEGATVMMGNSLPIREWNLAADTPKPGTRFFANRGANGIDGLVSTWLGVSAEAKESWLVLGDLSALYDLSAPWILPQLPDAKRRIVVINNGGGQIFSRVSWLKGADAQTKRAMVNPHDISFEPWAKLWNMEYRLFTDWQSLQDDDTPSAIWEVRPDVAETEAFWQAWK
ncbi:2-succinyl-5-enolpyruvyl-6-hydroxy-3-cyclohexene-1-carboxylic-acid synthase [soil metagenome]